MYYQLVKYTKIIIFKNYVYYLNVHTKYNQSDKNHAINFEQIQVFENFYDGCNFFACETCPPMSNDDSNYTIVI